jgi:hypothetical protein
MAEDEAPSKRPTDGFSVILFEDGSGTIQCAPHPFFPGPAA